jgi:PAS domain S-box-containing protein
MTSEQEYFAEPERQKRYLEALVEASPTAIVAVGFDGTIRSWNPAAERLFGFASAEALGKELDPLVAPREDLLQEARQRSALDAVGKTPDPSVTQRIRKDGSLVDVAIASTPIIVAGEQIGYFAFYSDVSELQQRTRELAEKGRELEIASKHKSDFLANMSHELRTPLNAIMGFSEVLREQMFGDLNERQLAYVDDVLAAGKHLLSLINDVLDLAKVEAGKMELELSEFAISDILKSAVSMHSERAGRQGVELSLTTEPETITVTADERRVRQVVFNLVSNAVKFTPVDGRVEISARADNSHVEVGVSDTGPGIAPEDREMIFEEFGQTTDGKRADGTGLGLPLSRKLVELHGGRLWAESEPGHGSTFRFTLPRLQEVP